MFSSKANLKTFQLVFDKSNIYSTFILRVFYLLLLFYSALPYQSSKYHKKSSCQNTPDSLERGNFPSYYWKFSPCRLWVPCPWQKPLTKVSSMLVPFGFSTKPHPGKICHYSHPKSCPGAGSGVAKGRTPLVVIHQIKWLCCSFLSARLTFYLFTLNAP